jgi:hypothetical protein
MNNENNGDEIDHIIGGDPEETISREQLLHLLEDGLVEAHYQVTEGRVRDPERDKVKQGWLRVLGYLANTTRQVSRDKDLEQLKERIEELERQHNEQESSRVR